MLVSSLPQFWSCTVVWGLLGVMWFYSMTFEINSFSCVFVPFQLCLAILLSHSLLDFLRWVLMGRTISYKLLRFTPDRCRSDQIRLLHASMWTWAIYWRQTCNCSKRIPSRSFSSTGTLFSLHPWKDSVVRLRTSRHGWRHSPSLPWFWLLIFRIDARTCCNINSSSFAGFITFPEKSSLCMIKRPANMRPPFTWQIGRVWTFNCVTLAQSNEHPEPPGSSSSMVVCISWNKGRCTAPFASCRYAHRCSVCSGSHWATARSSRSSKDSHDDRKRRESSPGSFSGAKAHRS